MVLARLSDQRRPSRRPCDRCRLGWGALGRRSGHLRQGPCVDRSALSRPGHPRWVPSAQRGMGDQSWAPCSVKPEYGYLWWLNDDEIPWPGAPSTGRSARGNGGRYVLWVDPARELVLASHWTDDVLTLIRDVSGAVTVSNT